MSPPSSPPASPSLDGVLPPLSTARRVLRGRGRRGGPGAGGLPALVTIEGQQLPLLLNILLALQLLQNGLGRDFHCYELSFIEHLLYAGHCLPMVALILLTPFLGTGVYISFRTEKGN